MEIQRPKVGIAIIIERDNKVLLGKRKGSHGSGSWAFPGGHLEFNESIEDCAKREAMEETGLTIENIKKDTFTNDIMREENKHYITCFVKADCFSGEPKIMEPNKCEEWNWFDWNNLPTPLFIPIQNLLKNLIKPRIEY
jgi:8-oxo-dGTP diphosphatase